MLERSRGLSALGTTLLIFGACSAQRDTTYPGEPLAVLRGTASGPSAGQPPPVDAKLLWEPVVEVNPPLRKTLAATKTAVNGQFPSGFTLQVMTIPPDDVMHACVAISNPGVPQKGRYAIAFIEAVRRGADDSNVKLTDLYGQAPEFRLVYADSDIDGCDSLAYFTRPVLSKGYHLLRRVVGPCPQANQGFRDGTCGSFSEVSFATSIGLLVQSEPVHGGPGGTFNIQSGDGPFCKQGFGPAPIRWPGPPLAQPRSPIPPAWGGRCETGWLTGRSGLAWPGIIRDLTAL